MGLFGRRKKVDERADHVASVVAHAQQYLASRGIETTVERGEQAEDVRLVAADGWRYLLLNTFHEVRRAKASEMRSIVEKRIDALLVLNKRDNSALGPDELRERVRVRLVSSEPEGEGDAMFQYARPVADGIMTVLCLDFPESVAILTDENLAKLQLGVDELFAIGQLRTDEEPIDEHDEMQPGVHVFHGGSMFVASHAVNLPALLGALPLGAVFLVPHRHVLIAVPLIDESSLPAINSAVGLMLAILSDGIPPGGLVSSDAYFWRDGVVSRIGVTQDEGSVGLHVDSRLQATIEELVEQPAAE